MRAFLVIGLSILSISAQFCQASDPPPTRSVRWIGGDSVWSEDFRWDPRGVPNNTPTELYSVTIDREFTITLDVPATVSELYLRARVFNIDQPLTTDRFILDKGTFVSGGAGLIVNEDLILRGGIFNPSATGPGALEIGGDIIKKGDSFAQFVPSEVGGDYAIQIERGTLRLSNRGVSIAQGGITVDSEFARLQAYNSYVDDIYLNNAHGYENQGAIMTSLSTDAALFGDIYVGDQGSTIGALDRLEIFGDIHGGSVDFFGIDQIILESGGHTYTGATSIGRYGNSLKTTLNRSELWLRGEGAIPMTTEINLGGRSRLILWNDNAAFPNRIPDSAPINSLGGYISIDRDSNTPSTEKMGQLNLLQGSTDIRAGFSQGSLLFDRLSRAENTTASFFRPNLLDQATIKFVDEPTTTNSILGGWAVTQTLDFATYDETYGVLPLADRVARPSQIEGATANDHVVIAGDLPVQLTSDHSIATLVMRITERNLNLGGNTLTLTQGGLLMEGGTSGSTSISGGQLTAGQGSGDANLYLHGVGGQSGRGTLDVEIRASIVDNGDGGSVSVIKAGEGEASLTGTNTYTGATIVQNGRLFFTSDDSLPSNGEVVVDGGEMYLEFVSQAPKQLSKVTLTQSGFLFAREGGLEVSSRAIIDADEYLLESGDLAVSLTGDGNIIKSTKGTASLERDNPTFSGDILIEEGVLVAGTRTDSRLPHFPLGTGTTTIMPGGTLVHDAGAPNTLGHKLLVGQLTLAGGDVGLSDVRPFSEWSFQGDWSVTAPSRLIMFDVLDANQTFEDLTIFVQGPVEFADGSGLEILGDGEARFVSPITIAGETFIDIEEGLLSVSRVGSDVPQAVLELRGKGSVSLPSFINNAGAGDFTLDVQPDVQLNNSSITISSRVTLALNNHPDRLRTLRVQGGTLTGDGVNGDVTIVSGNFEPGSGIGALTLRNLTQFQNGVLSMQLQGGDMPASDVLQASIVDLDGVLDLSVLLDERVRPGQEFDLIFAEQIDIEGLEVRTNGFMGEVSVITPISVASNGLQVLRLTVIPEPSSCALMLLLGIAVAFARARVFN